MRVLIFGLGSIARKHIHALRSDFKEVEITALRSEKESPGVENVTNIYSLDELTKDPDFIIISNPTHLHLSSIQECLKLNKPLFIEKPLFHKLDGVKEIIAKINSKKIKTYIACNLRFLDCIVYLKEYLRSNKTTINEVNAYCGSFLPEWRPGTDFERSYSANAEMGGGVHLDLVHELDYIYWLFGKPVTVNKKLTSRSSLNIRSVDYANYILEYESFCANIVLNYFRRDQKRSVEIVFDDDTFYVDIIKNQITSLLSQRVIFSSHQRIIDTYGSQIRYFVDSLRTGKPLMNKIEEAHEVLSICLN